MKQIGRRLKAARERAGLTQEDAADHMGVRRSTVANWEAARHLPSLVQFRQLLTLYAASPYMILYGKASPMSLLPEEQDELMSAVRHASVSLRLKVSMAVTMLAVED